MQSQFSPKLIKQCQKLIFKRAGIEITEGQAEIYLGKMGRLMLEIVKISDQSNNTNKNGKSC